MKRKSQIRPTAIATLSLLLLLAFAVGAQAAVAAHYSNGSAVTTPAAGTQGRGGVDASSVSAAQPLAGTQGRGGALVIAGAATSPAAGTAGRGGVAVVPGAPSGTVAASGGSSGTSAFAIGRPRGAFLPVPQAGNVPSAAVSPAPMSSSDWLTLGVILALIAMVVALVWAGVSRRSRREESALASYCSAHPGDSLCGAA